MQRRHTKHKNKHKKQVQKNPEDTTKKSTHTVISEALIPKSEPEQKPESAPPNPINLYQEFIIPQLIYVLGTIQIRMIGELKKAIDDPLYQSAVSILNKIPSDQLMQYCHRVNNLAVQFSQGGFLEGLKILYKIDKSLLNTPDKTGATAFLITFRNPDKTCFYWLLEQFEKDHIKVFDNEAQEMLVKGNKKKIQQFVLQYQRNKKELPITEFNHTKSDLLEDAALIGDKEGLESLIKYDNQFKRTQFNWSTAIEASILNGHDDITFFLLDHIIKRKYFRVLLYLFAEMMDSQFYDKPEPIEPSFQWVFRQAFVEKLISYLMHHKMLSEEEKFSIIKFPLLYLITHFSYTQESFDRVFSKALRLLEKKLEVPDSILNVIKKESVMRATAIKQNTIDGLKITFPYDSYKLIKNIKPLIKIEKQLEIFISSLFNTTKMKDGNFKHDNLLAHKQLLKNLCFYPTLNPSQLFSIEECKNMIAMLHNKNAAILEHYFFNDKNLDSLFDDFLAAKPQVDNMTKQTYLDNIREYLDERWVEDEKWGSSNAFHINTAKQFEIIIENDAIRTDESTEADLHEKSVQRQKLISSVFLRAVQPTLSFFDGMNHETIKPLITQFIELEKKYSSESDLTVMMALPFLLRLNGIPETIYYLDQLLTKGALNSPTFIFERLMSYLIYLTLLVRDCFNVDIQPLHTIKFIDTKTGFLSRMIRESIFSLALVPRENILLTDIDKIEKLKSSLFTLIIPQDYDQSTIPNEAKLTSLIVGCEILHQWVNNIDSHVKNLKNQLSLLELKFLILDAIKKVAQEAAKLSTGSNKASPTIKNILEKEQQLFCDLKKDMDAIENHHLVVENKITLPMRLKTYAPQQNFANHKAELVKTSDYTAFDNMTSGTNHRLFTLKYRNDTEEKNYARTRALFALDLSLSKNLVLISEYCNKIYDLCLRIQKIYQAWNWDGPARDVYNDSLQYRNHLEPPHSLKECKQIYEYTNKLHLGLYGLLYKETRGKDFPALQGQSPHDVIEEAAALANKMK